MYKFYLKLLIDFEEKTKLVETKEKMLKIFNTLSISWVINKQNNVSPF